MGQNRNRKKRGLLTFPFRIQALIKLALVNLTTNYNEGDHTLSRQLRVCGPRCSSTAFSVAAPPQRITYLDNPMECENI